MKRAIWILIISTLLVAGCKSPLKRASRDSKTVILVSIDGFRADYREKGPTPALDFIAETGVVANSLISCFPTKTFPNHYSIVTGLYPASHGIIANNMYDPVKDRRFGLGDRDAVADSSWWGGEPLWVTAEKQDMRTASFFWPGTEAAIQGVRPSYWLGYDGSIPDVERVDQVLSWLQQPRPQRPQFISVYFSSIDDAGHRYGPDAPEVGRAVTAIDSVMGRLLDGLRRQKQLDQVDIMITSDHGMSQLSHDRIIFVDDYVEIDSVDVVDWNPVLALNSKTMAAPEIYNRLSSGHSNWSVYRKEELPERFRYHGNSRIPEIVAVADDGWSITTHDYYARRGENFGLGTHGYDPALPSMQATFLARGPSFKRGYRMRSFRNIHLYELMAYVLGLQPAPNEGSLDSVRVMLAD